MDMAHPPIGIENQHIMTSRTMFHSAHNIHTQVVKLFYRSILIVWKIHAIIRQLTMYIHTYK